MVEDEYNFFYTYQITKSRFCQRAAIEVKQKLVHLLFILSLSTSITSSLCKVLILSSCRLRTTSSHSLSTFLFITELLSCLSSMFSCVIVSSSKQEVFALSFSSSSWDISFSNLLHVSSSCCFLKVPVFSLWASIPSCLLSSFLTITITSPSSSLGSLRAGLARRPSRKAATVSSFSSTSSTCSLHLPNSSRLLPSSPFTRWCTVSAAGARLALPDSGIALTVPEAALSSPQELGITSIHDTKAFPTLLPGQTLLSPVVCISTSSKPAALLTKPVVLSLPHCASLRQGGWTVSVAWRPQGEAAWRALVTLGQERVDTPLYAQLDLATVHLVTEHLGTFCLLGSPTPGGPAPLKSLRIAAFAQEVPQGADLTVRLYCVQDSEAAQAYLEWTERQFGGRLLDRPASCLLQHSGSAAPLALRLDRLGEGWAVQAGAELQQVPFSHLWTNNNPALHCSFTLRHTALHLSTLALSVSISQEGNPHRCGLKVHTSLATERLLRPSSSGCSSTDSPTAASPWRLPAHTKATLARMLDAPVSLGNDWRMLAERLNVHRYTAFFATKPSPTEALLVLWEARSREAAATQGLLGILRGMGRFDAAHLLEHDLQLA